jgi:ABC-2 type transport system permease protein
MSVDLTDRYPPGAATLWRILGVARRHAYVLQRSPHRLFDVIVWPVVDVLLFGSIGVFAASRAASGAAQFALYLLVGVILWHVVYQAQISVATGFLEETWSRSVLNLLATPMREWEYVLGVALFGMVKLVAAVGGVTLIVWAAFAFHLGGVGPGMIGVAALLLVVGWSIALFVIGLVLRFGTGAEAFAWGILFVVMPLSGAFYPVEALPAVVRPVAYALPTTYAFSVGRTVAAGEPMPWGDFATGAAMTAALAVAGLAYVTWMLRIFRRRGYVTRYS